MEGPAEDFSTLFEFLPIGAYRCAADGRLLRANPALVQLFGFGCEADMRAAIGQAHEVYADPARGAEFRRRLEQDGHVRGFVSEVVRRDSGERIWINENAHLVRDAAGRLLFYEGTAEDVSASVRAAAELRDSERELRQIAEHVPGFVFRLHVLAPGVLRYSFVSEGVRAVYGIEPEELLADGGLLRTFRHPEDDLEAERNYVRAFKRGGNVLNEYRIVDRSGRVKWIQVSSSRVLSEGGEPVRVGVVTDITAQREAEALRAQRDSAEAAQRAMRQLLSKASHELRTPLNAILGFSELMRSDPGTAPRHREWLAAMHASGEHLLTLVDDILDLSSAQSGKVALRIEPVPLAELVRECRTMLQGAADAMALRWDVAVGAALCVGADRRRLKQVISNLMSNAVKYNRQGGVIGVHAEQRSGRIEFRVSDTGRGLSAEQLARLFNPFERLGAQYSVVPGTGLGLVLSRQLVEAMGGEIRADSRPGEGSAFTVSLRAGDAPSTAL
jgi:PAS domain S-box-containing protein